MILRITARRIGPILTNSFAIPTRRGYRSGMRPRSAGPALIAFLVAACTPAPDSRPPAGGDTEATDSTEVIGSSVPPVAINEFMAENRRTVADGTGRYAPWVELYTPDDSPVDLDGWLLVGDQPDVDSHTLEQIGLEPGGFRLLFADGDPSLGPDHLGFTLSVEGGSLSLIAPGGHLVDRVSFGQQAPEVSAARVLDGAAEWGITATPTPGASNGGNGAGAGEDWAGPPPPCALGSDLADAFLLEGDGVTLHPTCTGAHGESMHLAPVNLPEGATWADGAFAWTTGPASGGRVDLVFAVTSEGRTDEVPLAMTLTFWVADDPSAPDNVPVDPLRYTEEWALPVLHIAAEGPITQNYVDAELTFEGRRYPATIKIRGASSAGYPKPSYTLEFGETKLDLPSWGVTRDHLVLVTPFDDNAYVRQKLIYDQWAAIAAFWGEARLTPRSFFAVVYLDGAYHGLFTALDHVDDEFLDQAGFDPASNLYKSVDHDANFYLTDASGAPKSTLHDGYEKKEGEPEDDFSDLDALVSFTGNADAEDLVDGAEAWLDLQEFMDWLLLVYYSLGEDSAGKNAYLAAAPGETRFRYAPWDFNQSWGQNWRTYRAPSDRLSSYEGCNKVFASIQAVEATDAELWERFRLMAQPGGPYDPAWISAQLDAYYALIEPSAERDWATWGDSYRTYGGWAAYRDAQGDWTDYQGEKAYLYQWLDERAVLFARLR
jgi:hypothetical protein